MNSEVEKEKGSNRLNISLPKPQTPLPKTEIGERHENHIDLIIKGLSRGSPAPGHAWIRTILCAGYPLRSFQIAYKRLIDVKDFFDKRICILPGIIDHHEIENSELEHLCDPITGDHEVQVHWRKNRIHGGTHFIVAIESNESSENEYSENLRTLDSIEALLRMCLGANAVIYTQSTRLFDLKTKSSHVYSPYLRNFGQEECARSDETSLKSLVDFAAQSLNVTPATARRVTLGLKWANQAFKQDDILSFWTALEILADCRGASTYPVIAEAYGLKKSEGQNLAKKLLIADLYKLRGDLTHEGIPIQLSLLGTSFLIALTHDLARHAIGLEPMKFAESLLGDSKISDLARRIEL